MANNNCYLNAAYIGAFSGIMAGRKATSSTATDYLKATQAAKAFATQLNSIIAFDALVTTSSSDPTMLVDTASQTIQSNTQTRPRLLQEICRSYFEGSYTEDATQADYAQPALVCQAQFVEALLLIVSP